jgi:O-antigen/teichoic acid export membrane protein
MATGNSGQDLEILREIRTAIRHTAVYGLGSIIVKALGFLMLPFYTHYLTPADYGLLEILDLSMSLFGMMLDMGIASALLRAYNSSANAEEKRRIMSTASLFVLATGLFIFLAGIGLIRPVSGMLFGPGVSPKYLLLSFGSFILSYLNSMPRVYLRALEASGRFTMLEGGSLCVMLLLNIYFIAGLHLGASGILWSSLIVNGVQAVCLSGWVFWRVGAGFNMKRLRQMLAFGLPLIFSNVALFSLNFSDRFFLQRLGALEVVGIYAVGYKLAFMLNYLLVQPFYAMWQGRMYTIYKQPEHRKVFRHIFALYSLALTYSALVLSVFSRDIVGVMTDPRYRGAEEVVPVIALAYVFYGLGLYVQLGLYLTDKTRAIGAIGAAAALLNLVLNYVLIRNFGMMGAAWATLGGFVAIAVGSYWYSEKALPLDLGMGRVAGAIAVAVAVYLISRSAAPSSGAIAIGVKAASVLIYPVLVWRLRIVSPGELGVLRSAGPKETAALAVGAVKS